MNIHLDMDFPVKDSECEYYCYPSCHPAQIFDEAMHGCTHMAWEQNQEGDFCPIVNCKGDTEGCEIPRIKLTKSEETELFEGNRGA